ncbi:uncharacterized protein [Littorina saxatilis]|uniref:CUB domain-containing protein n=1 Tax=Littorina saxatilis TaxID=31220 RepID=A0AAN9BGT8_9CAEN
MAHRCIPHLAVLLSLLITGCKGQCNSSRPRHLYATYGPDAIYSPGYPRHNYPNNANCTWLIEAEPSLVIRVRVVWMEVEQHATCNYDRLSLYDGRSSYFPRLARLCSGHGEVYHSSGHRVFLAFRSDSSITSTGFELEFSAINHWQVPSTTPLTTTTAWWLTRRTSTTTASYQWAPHVNTAALIGGITGGLVFLLVCCILCRYYCTRHAYTSRQQSPPFYPPLGPSAPPPNATIYQNNNAVFMVSAPGQALQGPAPPYGGSTNYAFSPGGEAPPAYFAVHHAAGPMQHRVGGASVFGTGPQPPPPTYTEAMKLSHPPAVSMPGFSLPPFPPSVASSLPLQTPSGNAAGVHVLPSLPPPYPPPDPTSIPSAPCRPAPPPPPRRPTALTSDVVTPISGQAPPTTTVAPPITGQAPPTVDPATPISGQATPTATSVTSPLGPIPPLPGYTPPQ